MTFWFLRSISMVSGSLWEMMENEANTADLLLIIDEGADYPGTFEKYSRSAGAAVTKMDAAMEPLLASQFYFYEPYSHNLALRKRILGWIKTRVEAPTVMAECIQETEPY